MPITSRAYIALMPSFRKMECIEDIISRALDHNRKCSGCIQLMTLCDHCIIRENVYGMTLQLKNVYDIIADRYKNHFCNFILSIIAAQPQESYDRYSVDGDISITYEILCERLDHFLTYIRYFENCAYHSCTFRTDIYTTAYLYYHNGYYDMVRNRYIAAVEPYRLRPSLTILESFIVDMVDCKKNEEEIKGMICEYEITFHFLKADENPNEKSKVSIRLPAYFTLGMIINNKRDLGIDTRDDDTTQTIFASECPDKSLLNEEVVGTLKDLTLFWLFN